MSFVKSVRAGGGGREIHLIQGEDQGRPAWYYLSIERKLAPLLKAKVAEGDQVDLTHYGEILELGFGEAPPQDVKARMEALANGEAAPEEEDDDPKKKVYFYFLMADDPQAGGRKFHAYIGIRGDRVPAFEQWAAHGNFDLKRWGVILEGGFGKPSAETIARMQEEYGIETPDLSEIPEDA